MPKQVSEEEAAKRTPAKVVRAPDPKQDTVLASSLPVRPVGIVGKRKKPKRIKVQK